MKKEEGFFIVFESRTGSQSELGIGNEEVVEVWVLDERFEVGIKRAIVSQVAEDVVKVSFYPPILCFLPPKSLSAALKNSISAGGGVALETARLLAPSECLQLCSKLAN
jgi:hypothetical protein